MFCQLWSQWKHNLQIISWTFERSKKAKVVLIDDEAAAKSRLETETWLSKGRWWVNWSTEGKLPQAATNAFYEFLPTWGSQQHFEADRFHYRGVLGVPGLGRDLNCQNMSYLQHAGCWSLEPFSHWGRRKRVGYRQIIFKIFPWGLGFCGTLPTCSAPAVYWCATLRCCDCFQSLRSMKLWFCMCAGRSLNSNSKVGFFEFYSRFQLPDLQISTLCSASALDCLPLCQSPEPPELSMLHEELAASAASVAQEFPNGTVPPERTMPACSANAKLLEPRCLCLLTKGVGSQWAYLELGATNN